MVDANDLSNVPFPACAERCGAFECFGVSECEYLCLNKFDDDGVPIKNKTVIKCPYCGANGTSDWGQKYMAFVEVRSFGCGTVLVFDDKGVEEESRRSEICELIVKLKEDKAFLESKLREIKG